MPRIICCLVAVALLLGACQSQTAPYQCTDPLGCVTIAPGAPVKFGILETLSGGSSPAGIEQTRAITLTLQMRQNQLLGHPIAVQIEDEYCSPEGGANAALRIVADPQVVGLWGTNCSSAAVTAGKIMSQAGLVMISAANSSPALTSVGDTQGTNWVPGYFRVFWNDTVSGSAAASFARQKLGVTKAAVVNAGDAYTKGLTDVFSQAFTSQGGTIVREVTIDENDANQRPTLEAVTLSGAELMFFPLSHPEAATRIVQQARALPAAHDLILIGGEGTLSEIFILGAGADGVGTFVPGPAALTNPADQRFRDTYAGHYGAAPASFYYSFAADAVNWLLDTIEKQPGVVTQDRDGTLHLGRQALRNALYATRDFSGLTGTISCTTFGDCGMAQLDIVRLDSAQWDVETLRANVIYTYTTRTSP